MQVEKDKTNKQTQTSSRNSKLCNAGSQTEEDGVFH